MPKVKGKGLVNSVINKLPFELHIPSYSYTGPGTKLIQRLERGDKPKNKLDEASLEHDIAYHLSKNLKDRHKADSVLIEKAWNRVKAPDSSIGEKLAAYLVTNIMKGKVKLGAGLKMNGKNNVIVAKKARKKITKSKSKKPTRVLDPPKIGGVLPLIFAGLGALGSIISGSSTALRNYKQAKIAQKTLDELQRHNKALETKSGQGLLSREYLTNREHKDTSAKSGP